MHRSGCIDGPFQPPERGHRSARTIECPVEPPERDRRHTDRGLDEDNELRRRQPMVRCGIGQEPEHQQVGRDHDHDAGGDRLLPQPRGLVLEVIEPGTGGDEAVGDPSGEAEEANLFGRRRVDCKPVCVFRVSLRGADLVGVAVLPHPALAEQPVGGAPGDQQDPGSPPAKPEQQRCRGNTDHEVDEATGYEVHRDVERRSHHPEVEVPRHREVVRELGTLEMPDP